MEGADARSPEVVDEVADEGSPLRRHLTLGPALALAVTTVIGGGALALPGVALDGAGNDALLGWALAGVITIPLLVVFSRLGARYPTAGGIAGFVRPRFGRRAAAGIEMVLLGTVSLGMPAIALSGGGYLAAAVGAPANTAWVGAVLLLLLVTGTLYVGAALSARLQTVLAIVLTIALVAVGLVGLLSPAAEFIPPSFTVAGWENAVGVVGVLFFGLTGWEIVAFTLGEYKNPKRDFPRVVALSFVIVIGVYLVLAAGIQAILRPGDATNETAPVAELVSRAVSPEAAVFVSVLGVVILAANLVGAMWGASRLVYASSGEGLLPRGLFHVAGASRTPRRAVLVVGGAFVLLVGASALGVISVTIMFEVAGQNFFLLYVVTAVVYGVEARSRVGRCFGLLLAAALAAVTLLGFDPVDLCYPAALFMIGCLIFRSRA